MKLFLVQVLMLVSSMAFAGKAERELQATINEKMKAGVDAVKANCGCAMKVDIKWDSYKTTDQMTAVKNSLDSFNEESKAYCTDAGAKKAVCAMKTIEYANSDSKDEMAFKGGIMKVTTLSGSVWHFQSFAEEVDK